MKNQNQWQKMRCVLVFMLLFMVFPAGSLAATLHAIIVADTDDLSIGDSAKIDLGRMQGLVADISRYTDLATAGGSITGDKFSRPNILSAIDNLSIGTDDVVIFYYAGHGSHLDTSTQWPSLYIKGDYLSLISVIRKLKNKKPRFLLVMADACNNTRSRFSITESRGKQDSGPSLSKNYREMFLNHRGYIIASGSEPGQSSWSNAKDGGFFTYSFFKSLNQALASHKKPSWHTVMRRAKAPIDLPKGGVQNPQTVVKIKPVVSGKPPEPDIYASPKPDIYHYMNNNDHTSMQSVLENAYDDQPAAWINLDTDNQYTMVVTNTRSTSSGYCRDFQVVGVIDGQRETLTGAACRQSDGYWKIQ